MKNKAVIFRMIKIYFIGTLLTLGLILSYLGIRININTFKDGIETSAKIVDIKEYDSDEKSGTYAYIEYNANGVTYTDVELDYYANNMLVNDEVLIYYSEADPSLILSSQVKTFQLGIMIMGIGMVIFSGLLLIRTIKR